MAEAVGKVLSRAGEVLKKLADSSQGSVERAVVIDREGAPVASLGEGCDELAACATAILSAAELAASLVGGREVASLEVGLRDGSAILIMTMRGYYLAVKTTKSPALGLVKFVLRRYAGELEKLLS